MTGIRFSMARVVKSEMSGILLIVALLFLWQVSAVYWTDSPNWPTLTSVAASIAAGFTSGEIPQVFGSSLLMMSAGYTIGVICGVGTGVLMETMWPINAILNPIVELLRPVPIPAIVPPLILLLGVDEALKIFVIAFSVFFPVLVNTIGGARAVDPVAIDAARTLRAGRWRTIRSVVIPASLPYILAGMRTALSLALIITVTAEMIAGSAGIGYYLIVTQYAMRPAEMYGAVLLLALLGYVLNLAFLVIERRLLHWYHVELA
jgi:ABC-type nitrate/sulfonate/bicarbonate transport system permease component